MFLHRNIHKFCCKSSDGKTSNQVEHILLYKRHHSPNTGEKLGVHRISTSAVHRLREKPMIQLRGKYFTVFS
jgi:hypothetical protein